MGRPRVVDDERLLDAAQAAMNETGPAGFTLERAAARAGTSAAIYVKRFGSKRELLLALNRRWLDSIEPGLAQAVAPHRRAVDRLRAAALWGFEDMDDPSVAANLLAALAVDLADDEMRAQLAQGWALVKRRLAELAAMAVRAGELGKGVDPDEVAEVLFVAGEGTRLSWSVQPRGSLVARAAATIDAVLSGLQAQR